MFDLHTHTTYSDGDCTPEQLIERAGSSGLSHLAITDHDNHDALLNLEHKYSLNAAREIGGIRIISGVEFSTRWENIDIHVLALNYRIGSASLETLLKRQTAARAERNARIYEKLASAGIELEEPAPGLQQLARIGRLHIAEEMVSLGKAKHTQQAFKRYLGKSGRAYVAANWQPLSGVLEAIARSDGSSVLAHPLKYKLTRSKLKRLIADFAALGGDGIEVISGKQVQTQTQMLAQACLDHGLKASLGSDFHAPNRPWAELGVAGYLPKACDPIWDSWSL